MDRDDVIFVTSLQINEPDKVEEFLRDFRWMTDGLLSEKIITRILFILSIIIYNITRNTIHTFKICLIDEIIKTLNVTWDPILYYRTIVFLVTSKFYLYLQVPTKLQILTNYFKLKPLINTALNCKFLQQQM